MRKLITETPRLFIRNWLQEDIAPYAKIIGDPEVMQFIGDGKPKPFEEAIRAVEKYNGQIEKQGWARFAVALKDTDLVIGFCGFDFYEKQLDFGWRLAKDQWGKGYATEAANAVLELGIHQFNFNKINCHAFKENKGSINVIEKLGIPFEKEWLFHGKPVREYAWTRSS